MRTRGSLATISFAAVAAAYYWFIHAPALPEPDHSLEHTMVEIAGRERYFELFVPHGVSPNAALLLVFHGSMGDTATIRRRTGYRFEAIADREGFLVAYPRGIGGFWNGCRKAATHIANAENIDDVAFVRRLVSDLVESGRVNADRVYATGYSNGGHMAYRLALESPDLVAGIAPFAANFPTEENLGCHEMSKPVKTVITNGTDDRLNPFYGGEMSFIGFGTLGHVRSSENTAHYFRNLYKSGSEHSATISGSSRAFAQIDELKQMGVPVVALVTIYNGGHTIPQTYYRFPRLLGATFENDQVIEYIWDFLDAAGPSATAIRTGQKNESPQ